jgi:hypothetical protein
MPLIDETQNTTRMVALDDLVPHPLNANVMPDAMLGKLRAHIKRTGRYPHLIVRPHPLSPGASRSSTATTESGCCETSATARPDATSGRSTTARRRFSSPP